MLSTNIYKAFKTVNEMLKKRGYSNDYESTSYDDFLNTFESLQQLTIKSEHPSGKKVVVYFPEVETKNNETDKNGHIGIKQIREYIDLSIEEDIHNIILIVLNDATTFAQKEMQNDKKNGIKIEIFKYEDLQIDITRHELVPEHRLLTEEEKLEVLKEFSTKIELLPRITTDDPVSKFYGFEKHDMIKITGFSETAGIRETYRVVV